MTKKIYYVVDYVVGLPVSFWQISGERTHKLIIKRFVFLPHFFIVNVRQRIPLLVHKSLRYDFPFRVAFRPRRNHVPFSLFVRAQSFDKLSDNVFIT